jgi:uncharacterized membrane protein YidH (DUF202 family)
MSADCKGEKPMSKSAQSLFVFSIYLFTLGLILLIIPNFLLSIFSVPETQEVWIRVVGMLVIILGYFDFQASKNEMKKFFHWSVHVRALVPIVFVLFVLLGLAPPILILFGIIDGLAALWTHLSLRSEIHAMER